MSDEITALEPIEPMEIEVPKVKGVTAAQFDKAAGQVNMVLVRAKTVQALAKMGAFVSDIGAVNIGLGRLLVTGEALDNAIRKCNDVLNDVVDPEVAAELLSVQKELAGKSIDMALAFTKIKEGSRSTGSGAAAQSFPPDAIVVGAGHPVQINVLPKQDQKQ